MMCNKRILLAIAPLLFVGCDRPKESAAPADGPAKSVAVAPTITQPAEVAINAAENIKPAVKAPTTRPVVSTLLVGGELPDPLQGRLVEFPRARLHINKSDNTAVLYSDDPKNAIDRGYSGNSYYMVIPLDKNDPLKLDGYQWHFQSADSTTHRDSADSVFLEGQRYHLQPDDVQVGFRGEGAVVEVAVMGLFSKFDTAANSAEQFRDRVYVKGIVEAKVDIEK